MQVITTPVSHRQEEKIRLEDLPDFLTTQQFADLLQISMNTARSLLQSSAIPAIKVGRSWRISKARLIAHLLAASHNLS